MKNMSKAKAYWGSSSNYLVFCKMAGVVNEEEKIIKTIAKNFSELKDTIFHIEKPYFTWYA